MRIISGKYKGRHINPPKNLPVRPTTDYAKSGLFNILTNNFDFEELKVLDLFTGTGSISYEFVSRGCNDITCVDANLQCVRFVQESLNSLNPEHAKVIKYDVFKFVNICNVTFDFIFADPPFDMKESHQLPTLIFEKKLVNEGGWFVLEHSSDIHFNTNPNFKEERNYGKVAFSIFTVI